MREICLNIVVLIIISEIAGTKMLCENNLKPCLNQNYRSIDGSCNNLDKPNLGKSSRALARLLTANYADGVSKLPVMASGKPYLSARDVSNKLFPEGDITEPKFTLMLMQMGQMLAHDMSFLPSKSSPASCCSSSNKLGSSSKTSQCADIIIPPNDPDYPKSFECLSFLRGQTIASCPKKKEKDQVSVATGFIDMSYVYGSSASVNIKVRLFSGGKLKTEKRDGRIFPLQAPNKGALCPRAKSKTEVCYFAGDGRINQNPQLTALHILFYIEHNNIATKLAKLNPSASDEKLYQEARRINIAQMQHIAFNEIIFWYLGKDIMIKDKLIFENAEECIDDYDKNVDPTVYTEFTSGAYRHFHSLIIDTLSAYDSKGEKAGQILISDYINRGLAMELNNSINYDTLLYGLAFDNPWKSDKVIDEEIKSKFDRNDKTGFGEDLAAVDIQRGRDTGLPRYVDIRKLCNLSVPKSFEDLQEYIPKEDVDNLKAVYETPEDIELYTGGGLETPLEGTLAGPTFLCLMSKQFQNSRRGDRFFYENCEKTGFTKEQLNSIRKITLAKVICNNSDIKNIQKNVVIPIGPQNPSVPCDELPEIDLSLFKIK